MEEKSWNSVLTEQEEYEIKECLTEGGREFQLTGRYIEKIYPLVSSRSFPSNFMM